ncbi:MAG: UDP-3-O-[3-hydroxymyristoyl] glucosamine N-acyltransferase [Pseudohongiellaceae bacterium]|jgi:UDP-3-O-[3-hydroxymyristoyl] glucosamine N-acyltransferase
MKLDRTVSELAAVIGGHVEGNAVRQIARLCQPDDAGVDDMVVVFRATTDVSPCRAGCLVVSRNSAAMATAERSLIRVDAPEAALDQLARVLGPDDGAPAAGIHPTAVVAETAVIHETAAVGAGVFVGEGAIVGAGAVLWPGVCLGRGVVLGDGCKLHFRVVVEARCRLGERVELHSGTVIGADGFGYRQEGGLHLKSPQVGWVELGDDVEIGANSTIDRGRLAATRIGDRTKIDDGVHVAHNCQVGSDCALAGQVALAGGVHLGNGVLMGGRSGVSDGLSVPDGTIVGGCAVVLSNPDPGQYLLGIPAQLHRDWKRQVLSLAKLPAVIASWKRRSSSSEPEGRDP